MYCIKCGKEIPDNSLYCPFCGKRQTNDKEGFSLSKLVMKYKVILLLYLVWCFIHIGLFLSSKPEVRKGHWSFEKTYDQRIEFYPFDTPLSNVIQGKRFWFDPINNINAYDTSELFFYTLLLPSIVLLFVLFWKKCKRNKKTNIGNSLQRRLSFLSNINGNSIKTYGEKCSGWFKNVTSKNRKSKLLLIILFLVSCVIYYYPKGNDNNQDDEIAEEMKYTSHSTGDVPYFAYYGYTLECDECSGVQVTAPQNSDVIVIVKKDNEQGKVVGNVYICAGDTYKIGLKEDGIYQTFFYYGEDWNPQKDMGNGIKGGFESNEHFSKDKPQNIQNSVLSYVLQLQRNGNFKAKDTNRSDIFK